jgi:pyrimidine operon attenuation protein/uracil phosphoribosyltransferase
MSESIILTEEDMRRAIVRIAHEIVENNRGCHDLVFVGMQTRGVPLARRLSAAIADFEHDEVPVGALDIGLYRDDVPARGVTIQIKPSEIPTNIADRRVVLVDDVLYTGRSIRAALDALIDYGRPERIQLAVLVDRGHRELPIRADYVGKNIPTSHRDEVEVRFQETDGVDEVVLVSPEED